MNAKTLGGLGVALSLWASTSQADEVVWRPAKPAATLGRPLPLGDGLAPAGYGAAPADPPRVVVRAQADDVPPIPPLPPSAGGPPSIGGLPAYPPGGYGTPPPTDLYNNAPVADAPHTGPGFWDRCRDLFDFKSGPLAACGGRKAFQSDHAFDNMISPVTNPFLFEDPRALTELRPVFLYQTIPTKNNLFHGGDAEFFGVQGRLALTERWSITLSKLGGVWINPREKDPGFEGGSGFGEIHVGPKWTFIHSDRSGTVGAVGVNFEIPTGAARVFQDTGSLSVVPYFTIGQTFGRSSYGSFNVLGTFGYALGVDDKRSDSFFTGLHLDYDIANAHKIYALMELNWTHYTTNGSTRDVSFEGRDLANFGARHVDGHNELSLAAGLRYKFTENVQFGTAVEFPISGSKDLQDFRLTVDMIFRW